MCFNSNADDWTAETVEVYEGPNDERIECGECGQWINVGEWRKFIHLEECETCRRCENGDCECPAVSPNDEHECKCNPPDFGNTLDHTICERCDKLLKAIMHAELVAGCKPSESQPAYGELREALIEDDRYIDVALQMFPEIAAHIDRMIGHTYERAESAHDVDLIELGAGDA